MAKVFSANLNTALQQTLLDIDGNQIATKDLPRPIQTYLEFNIECLNTIATTLRWSCRRRWPVIVANLILYQNVARRSTRLRHRSLRARGTMGRAGAAIKCSMWTRPIGTTGNTTANQSSSMSSTWMQYYVQFSYTTDTWQRKAESSVDGKQFSYTTENCQDDRYSSVWQRSKFVVSVILRNK